MMSIRVFTVVSRGQLNRGGHGQIKAMLEVVDGRMNSDADESSDDQGEAGWTDEEDDGVDDDRMDEDEVEDDNDSDEEEEDPPEPNPARNKPKPVVQPEPAFTTPKRRGRPPCPKPNGPSGVPCARARRLR